METLLAGTLRESWHGKKVFQSMLIPTQLVLGRRLKQYESLDTLFDSYTNSRLPFIGVKSYPNAVVSLDSKPLSQISSMQSSWSWSYTGSSIVADVSYDMFTSSSAGGSNEYEIMIWLAALGGAGPISSKATFHTSLCL